jgi:preprotein translocase subunit SecF
LFNNVKNNQYFINDDRCIGNNVYFLVESLLEDLSLCLSGIVVGTYSSLFIATPVLVDTISREDKS